MNEQTSKLFEQLAQKLGTTTEYLWGVLLKQAPIQSTLGLIKLIAVLLFGLILWKIHKKLSKEIEGCESYDNTLYLQKEEYVTIPMITAFILFLVLFIVSMINISSIVYGYFNPEYWALKEVMSNIN